MSVLLYGIIGFCFLLVAQILVKNFREPNAKEVLTQVVGKNVVIAGASSGIGEQLAYVYASNGARIVLSARRQAQLDLISAKCISLGAQQASVVVADFVDAASATKFVEAAVQAFNSNGESTRVPIHVLHLNHALLESTDWYAEAGTEEQWSSKLRAMLQVTFLSFVDIATAAIPFLEHGEGRIVVSSSGAGQAPCHLQAPYSAAKHALHGFFGSFRQDLLWHRSNISVSVAVIGRVQTESASKALGHTHKHVPQHNASGAARALVAGGWRRSRTIYFPAGQMFVQDLFARWFPAHYDALVVLSAQSHPCTNVWSEAMMIFSCYGEISRLLSIAPSARPVLVNRTQVKVSRRRRR